MIEACLYVPEEGRRLQEFSMRGLLKHVVVVVMYFQSVLHMIGPVLMSDFSYASQLFVIFLLLNRCHMVGAMLVRFEAVYFS